MPKPAASGLVKSTSPSNLMRLERNHSQPGRAARNTLDLATAVTVDEGRRRPRCALTDLHTVACASRGESPRHGTWRGIPHWVLLLDNLACVSAAARLPFAALPPGCQLGSAAASSWSCCSSESRSSSEGVFASRQRTRRKQASRAPPWRIKRSMRLMLAD